MIGRLYHRVDYLQKEIEDICFNPWLIKHHKNKSQIVRMSEQNKCEWLEMCLQMVKQYLTDSFIKWKSA